MACCGGRRHAMSAAPRFGEKAPVKNTRPLPKPKVTQSITQTARVRCGTCGGSLAYKVKKTLRGWVQVLWCPKCRLEV